MSKATTEFKIEVSDGRSSTSKKVTTNLDDVLILIEASKLGLEDDFMKYRPGKDETRVKNFKELLTQVIKKEVADFHRPKFDPSFANKQHTEICYVAGKKPAIGKPCDAWVEMAKKFCPERESKIMKKSEYIAFRGWLIKKLVENGWSKKKAWNAVCPDLKKIGHYWDSKNAKHDFETIKSREILDLLYDLGSTCKLLIDDDDEGANKFCVAGGDYFYDTNGDPLTALGYFNDFDYCKGVGLLAFSA